MFNWRCKKYALCRKDMQTDGSINTLATTKGANSASKIRQRCTCYRCSRSKEMYWRTIFEPMFDQNRGNYSGSVMCLVWMTIGFRRNLRASKRQAKAAQGQSHQSPNQMVRYSFGQSSKRGSIPILQIGPVGAGRNWISVGTSGLV